MASVLVIPIKGDVTEQVSLSEEAWYNAAVFGNGKSDLCHI